MPKDKEEEIDGEEEVDEEDDDDEDEEEDEEEQDQAEVLDMIAESLTAAMEECVEADVVNDSYIELQLNDGKKWKISIKQID